MIECKSIMADKGLVYMVKSNLCTYLQTFEAALFLEEEA